MSPNPQHSLSYYMKKIIKQYFRATHFLKIIFFDLQKCKLKLVIPFTSDLKNLSYRDSVQNLSPLLPVCVSDTLSDNHGDRGSIYSTSNKHFDVGKYGEALYNQSSPQHWQEFNMEAFKIMPGPLKALWQFFVQILPPTQ